MPKGKQHSAVTGSMYFSINLGGMTGLCLIGIVVVHLV